jgi:hypothetical protein
MGKQSPESRSELHEFPFEAEEVAQFRIFICAEDRKE